MKKTKLVFIAGMGTLFEVFDFYLFSLFAISLNYSFFGSVNQHSILWIFLIFSVGYLARIIGALVFGYWGDKFGRLYSFKKTIVIMAISSIAIGFLPTYQSIGMLAVVLLIVLRFIQGVSFGGEYTGAVIIIIERYKKHLPLLIMCISLMGVVGIFLAKFTYGVLDYFFDHQSMMDYGWRIAYIVGGVLIFHSYQARKTIAESAEFKLNKEHRVYRNSICKMLSHYKEILLWGTLSMIGIQIFWGAFLIYLPNYMSFKYHSPIITSYIYYTMISGLVSGQIIGGVIADKINIRSAYTIGTILCLLLIVPFYRSMAGSLGAGLEQFYILLFFISLSVGISNVLYILQLAQRFPIQYRYTLVSSAYALSAFLFIGLPPFLFSYFTREISMYYPMLVFGICYIIQLISIQIFYQRTKNFIEQVME